MFSKNYKKEESNQRNQVISKYVRETVKGIACLDLRKKACFYTTSWMKIEVDEEDEKIKFIYLFSKVKKIN